MVRRYSAPGALCMGGAGVPKALPGHRNAHDCLMTLGSCQGWASGPLQPLPAARTYPVGPGQVGALQELERTFAPEKQGTALQKAQQKAQPDPQAPPLPWQGAHTCTGHPHATTHVTCVHTHIPGEHTRGGATDTHAPPPPQGLPPLQRPHPDSGAADTGVPQLVPSTLRTGTIGAHVVGVVSPETQL